MTSPDVTHATDPTWVDDSPKPLYYAVSPLKLAVMSICTFGIYNVCWFYWNWKIVKARETSDVSPVLRAIFGLIFAYSLFDRMRTHAERLAPRASIPAGALAFGLFASNAAWRFHGAYWLAGFVSVIILCFVQDVVNDINAKASPGIDENREFDVLNLIVALVGGVVLILAIVGSVVSPE